MRLSFDGFISRVLLAGIVALLTASASFAQLTAQQQSALKANCRSDFMSKCSGVRPGGQDALVCLQRNVESLSAACKTAVTATMPKPAAAAPPAAAPAPAAKVEQPAAPQAAPQPVVAAPSEPAAPKAAAAPRTVTPAPPPPAAAAKRPAKPAKPVAAVPAAHPAATPTAAQQSAMRQSCRNDFMSHCSGVAPGGKEALACLQKNVHSLSAGCQRVVSGTMAAAPAATAAAPAPQPAAVETQTPVGNTPAFAPGAGLVAKACARDLLMHCRGQIGEGRALACLKAYHDSGHRLSFRCQAVLKMEAKVAH